MENVLAKIKEATAYIEKAGDLKPGCGIVLGTGLGALVKDINIAYDIEYANIPHFPVSTVESHSGRLIFGTLEGVKVVVMQGRFHYYEGYSMQQVTFPIRVMKALGIKKIFLSNAAGSLKENIKAGDLMIIRDHINLLPESPLRGLNDDELGPRFPDLFQAYNPAIMDKACEIAETHNIRYHKGVYVSIQGPALETPAEYNYLHLMGADAVGMSTVPEVIVARHSGLKVFAVSVITDVGYPLEVIKPLTLEDVLRVAGEAEPHLTILMKELISAVN